MDATEYVKLTPARRSAAFGVVSVTRSNLWLGKDHLLCVETEGYTEKYRRYYFRDIQVITIYRTRRRMVWNLILGIPLAICAFFLTLGLVAISSRPFRSDDLFGFVGVGIPAAVLLAALLINTLRGPTCKCELRTAVQTENVPSMSRVRRARKVLDRIRPLIAEAQGQLTPEDAASRFRELIRAPDREPPVMEPPEAGAAPQP